MDNIKILSIEGTEIEACFQFEYGGFLVSASTIDKEVRIFFLPDLHKVGKKGIEFSSIPEAIEWINENFILTE